MLGKDTLFMASSAQPAQCAPSTAPISQVPATRAALAWIGLGANLGNARQTLSDAVSAISAWPHSALEIASALYRSSPIDADGPDYTNAVIRIRTDLQPLALLHQLQTLELAAGRLRPYRNAPRSLDLDLLDYAVNGQAIALNTAELTLPHPRMHERAFVLRPLHSIDPARVLPEQLNATHAQFLEPLANHEQWPWSALDLR